ncbi:unnamed protein product [Urochloa humidicola]
MWAPPEACGHCHKISATLGPPSPLLFISNLSFSLLHISSNRRRCCGWPAAAAAAPSTLPPTASSLLQTGFPRSMASLGGCPELVDAAPPPPHRRDLRRGSYRLGGDPGVGARCREQCGGRRFLLMQHDGLVWRILGSGSWIRAQ